MATKVTIELPDSVYRKAQAYARLHQQEVGAAISMLIEQGSAANKDDSEIVDWTEPDPDMD